MAGYSEQEHKELAGAWLRWLFNWQNGQPTPHAEKQAVFLDMSQRFGRPAKSYETKTYEYSACAVWLGFGPVLGFPGCPTQKDLVANEPVPEGFELTPDEVEKLKVKQSGPNKGKDRFMRWHGPNCATKKAVMSAAVEAGITIKPLQRAPRPRKVKK